MSTTSSAPPNLANAFAAPYTVLGPMPPTSKQPKALLAGAPTRIKDGVALVTIPRLDELIIRELANNYHRMSLSLSLPLY